MKHTHKKRLRRFVALTALLACMVGVFAIPGVAALRQGDRGNDVTKVQQKLQSWGYYKGGIDGIFGQLTDKAVRAFQRNNGLTADGIVGTQTAKAMGITLSSSGSGSSSYSNSIELLARMITAEGRGEPYIGQVAIGAVIMNRIKHPSFPNTLSGVLYQSGAFSALDDGQFWSVTISDSCRRAAIEAYNGSDPTYGCIYYYNPAKTSNKFMLSRPIVITIGEHVFCK